MSDTTTPIDVPVAPPLVPLNARDVGAVTISVIVTLAFCGVTAMIFVTAVPDSSRDLANMLFGGLMGMQGAVVNYWIGSSSGSAVKDRKQ